jgi:hypothetical protein
MITKDLEIVKRTRIAEPEPHHSAGVGVETPKQFCGKMEFYKCQNIAVRARSGAAWQNEAYQQLLILYY